MLCLEVLHPFNVQLKFESLLSLMLECRTGPIRKTVQLSLLRLNPNIFEKESWISIKALNEFGQKSVKKLESSAKSVCLISILFNEIALILLCFAIAFANNSIAKINKHGKRGTLFNSLIS